jgi:hypothetical protein
MRNMLPAISGSMMVMNVTVKATIKKVGKVNKCGPDVDIAAMRASVWFWERGKLSAGEASAIEAIFLNWYCNIPSYSVFNLPTCVGADDSVEDEMLCLVFHNGSLTFIPKNPYKRVSYFFLR